MEQSTGHTNFKIIYDKDGNNFVSDSNTVTVIYQLSNYITFAEANVAGFN